MVNLGEIMVRVSADISNFRDNMSEVQQAMSDIGDTMMQFGSTMTTFVTLPIIVATGFAIKFASDTEESLNKVNVAFGSSAQTVVNWSKTSINSMGLASQTALDSAALYGDMATSMGIAQNEAAAMSTSLVQLGADMASFKNVPIEQAMMALNGVFTGETEALTTLGVVMLETNLQEFALSKGIQKKVEKMTQAEKVMLRYAFVMDKTTNAQGDFTRTSEGTANQMRMFMENLKQLAASFGKTILPAFNAVLTKINEWLKSLEKTSPGFKKFIAFSLIAVAAIGPLVAGIGALLIVLPFLSQGIKMVIPVIASLGRSLMALFINPVGLTILAITALITAGVLLYKNWDAVSSYVSDAAHKFSLSIMVACELSKMAVASFLASVFTMVSRVTSFLPGISKTFEAGAKNLSKYALDARKNIAGMSDELNKPTKFNVVDEKKAKKASRFLGDMQRTNDKLADSSKNAAKALKDQYGALAPFDKLNILNISKSMNEMAQASANNNGGGDGFDFTIPPIIIPPIKLPELPGLKSIKKWWNGLKDFLQKPISTIFDTFPSDMTKKFKKDYPKLSKFIFDLGDILTSPTKGLPQKFTESMALISKALDDKGVLNDWSTYKKKVSDNLGKLFDSIKESMSKKTKEITESFTGFWGGLWDDFVSGLNLAFGSKTATLSPSVSMDDKASKKTQSFGGKLWGDFLSGLGIAFNGKSATISTSFSLDKKTKEKMKEIGSKLWDIFKKPFTQPLEFFKDVINTMTGMLNKLIKQTNEAFSFTLPGGKKFGLDIKPIPMLAQGGVINTATVAMIGEAGKEAVVPLENNLGWANDMANILVSRMPQTQGATPNVNVYIGEEQVQATIRAGINKSSRMGGFTPMSI